MSKILIVADHLNGQLNGAVARCVTAARAIDGAEIHIVVLAADPTGLAAQAAAIEGLAKVLTVANAAFDHLRKRNLPAAGDGDPVAPHAAAHAKHVQYRQRNAVARQLPKPGKIGLIFELERPRHGPLERHAMLVG